MSFLGPNRKALNFKLQVKKGGPHCVFSITVGLLHQSTCCGKELAKKSLTSSRSDMISRSSSPGNFFPVTLEIWTEFVLSQHFCYIIPILDSWCSFPSFLFIHSFVYSISNQWTFMPYMEQILDFVPQVQNDNTHYQKLWAGGMWSRIYDERLCIHSTGLNWLSGNWPEVVFSSYLYLM